jgi:hypothetical protein
VGGRVIGLAVVASWHCLVIGLVIIVANLVVGGLLVLLGCWAWVM